jgi:hypothetical protein
MGLGPASPSSELAAELPAVNPEDHHYRISKIIYEYGAPGSKPNPKLPPIGAITAGSVAVGRIKDGFTSVARGQKKLEVPITGGKVSSYYGDALLAFYNDIVEQLNKKYGIYGVYVLADPDQIDPVTLEDKRPKDKTALTVRVYASEVTEVRTVFRKVPSGPNDEPQINDPKHARIRLKSPLPSISDGLFLKAPLQAYLDRINRFPGRRVDSALNATGVEGKVDLDYLIREQKHFSIYVQSSNTGTKETGEWRTRAGFQYQQLMGLDDTLSAEYGTSDFHGYQSALLSYEVTPIFPDYLKLRVYGNWSSYSSADIGLSSAKFTGNSLTWGGEATWTPIYLIGFPLDLSLGAEWLNAGVNNGAFGVGSTDFLMPYVAVGTDKTTDKYSLSLNGQVQTNWAGAAGTDHGTSLDVLGRSDTSRYFTIGKYNALLSFYLEPLLFGKQWDDQTVWWKSTRAHEIVLDLRGQAAFDDARLAPQLQYVAGGFYTVRGYPESFTTGDSALLGSVEYRLHIPRLFKPHNPAAFAAKPPVFNLFPPGIGQGADWDLIFRTFLDYGQTLDDKPEPFEHHSDMLGAGAGLELQIFKPIFISLRADLGFALLGASNTSDQRVNPGYSRLNLSASLAW